MGRKADYYTHKANVLNEIAAIYHGHKGADGYRSMQKCCTDFTYLFLKNSNIRYNCSIIDLYDWSVVASITDRPITRELAIRTL